MSKIFARFLDPLTYSMWVIILIGAIDHFFVKFLPKEISDLGIYIMWPLLLCVWYGHRYKAKIKAQTKNENH
ncbi:MAG: hypothetical protein CL568_07130 [Alphaproteobacteria bacterium]|jgi:hypothetical protein|nr:hypothetical protein [Alphaproteobacteria bacterium]PPR12714.1 MAG: hypothetical protein CFH42_02075 [Alphaproteobacteria bacterium MarineAlpha12_Bin1]|tara:strand:- start:838 stop:1053 length:216 start_codon:yes stop_codon:yes gene_type:complete